MAIVITKDSTSGIHSATTIANTTTISFSLSGSPLQLSATALTDGTTITSGGSGLAVVSGGIGTTQLANNSVTYGKIQTMAANTLLGNPTGSTATPQAITLGNGLANSSTTLIWNGNSTSQTISGAWTFSTTPTISNAPVSGTDAVNKTYVDDLFSETGSRHTAFYATTTSLGTYTYSNGASGVGATITASSNGAYTNTDGQTATLNDIVLVKNETSTNAPYNGLYKLTQVGDGSHPFILTRYPGADTSTNLSGMVTAVEFGTVNSGSLWLLNVNNITVGTTNLTFIQLNSPVTLTYTAPINIAANNISLDTHGVTASYFRQSSAVSVVGNNGSSTANVVDITSGGNYYVLQANSTNTALSWGMLTGNNMTNNTVGNAQIRQSSARSVVGNSTGSTANVADITATSGSDAVLRESGGSLGFGTIATGGIANSAVTYAKIQNVTAGRLLGNGTGGAAAPQEITPSARFSLSSGAVDLASNSITNSYLNTSNSATSGYVLGYSGSQMVWVVPTSVGQTASINASESITAPAIVSLYNNAGTINVRNANATDGTRPANGFILTSVTTGNPATVYFFGTLTGLSSLTPASRYYLNTTNGAISTSLPNSSGNIQQLVGYASSATTLQFQFNDYDAVP